MTHLYFLRHGIAADRGTWEDDRQRPLTAEGNTKTQKIAERLHSLGLHFDFLLTSPLLRARQTTEIIGKVFSETPWQESPWLAPEGSFQDWLTWFVAWQKADPKHQSLGLIGHEPDLSVWAEILVWGAVKGNIALKKGGVLGLTVPEDGNPIGRCTLFLLVPPKILLG